MRLASFYYLWHFLRVPKIYKLIAIKNNKTDIIRKKVNFS